MESEKIIVDYVGVCVVCGSMDGMVVKGKDGRFRNMCRVMGCPCWMRPAPAVGFDSIEDCREPWETEYLKSANDAMTVAEYLSGKKEVDDGA